MAKSLGQIAFEAFNGRLQGSGARTQSWADNGPLCHDAWEAAASAIKADVERTQPVQAGISGEANKKGEPNG